MKIITEIGKTWQEVQYEPFSIKLSIEREVKIADDKAFQEDANKLQVTAEMIYNERRKIKAKANDDFIQTTVGRRRNHGVI